jgi:Undecaprenyl-phosphate galactose phosphotransferase WbaP
MTPSKTSLGPFGLALAAFDILALALAGWFAVPATIALQEFLGRPLYDPLANAADLHQNIYIVLGGIVVALLWNKGLYSRRIPWWRQIQAIGKIVFFLFLAHGFISFALRLYESRLLIALSWAFVFALLLSLRWSAFRFAARAAWLRLPTVLVGDGASVVDLAYALESDLSTGYDVQTIFLRDPDFEAFDRAALPRARHAIDVRDGRGDLESYIRANPGSFYIVALDTFRGETRDHLIKTLGETKSAYAVVPALSGANLYDMEPCYFFGHDVTLLEAHTAPKGFSLARAAKRLMDVMISGTALIALFPFLAAIAAALKIEGQSGSPFYGGKRVGKGGKEFRCWKFQTMEPNSDHLLQAYLDADPEAKEAWEKYRKLQNDPRVTTRTARIVRKTSLDELPQLWNVLLGDMSLVGPRPILADEIRYFGDTIHDYLSVRPGITGLWQVSGRNDTTFAQRVVWDRWYVRNWSLWGDIVILIKTPFVILSRKGAS